MSRLPSRLLVPGLFLLALAARAPTLGLPLQGDSAVLASVADHLAHERGFDLAGHAPFTPCLTSIVISSGVGPTAALRWVDALLSALLAPLLWVLLRRLRIGRRKAAAAAALLALHPLAIVGAGGVLPGSETAGTLLLLTALTGLLSTRAAGRRLAAVCTVLLTTADPGALVYVPFLLWAYARTESGPRFQTAFLLLGALFLCAAPFLWLDLTRGGGVGAGQAALWSVLATLLVLLPALPFGVADLYGRGPVAHAWLGGAGLALLALGLRAPVLGTALLALMLSAGVVGAAAVYARFAPRLVGGALVVSALISAGFVLGGLPSALAPGESAGAGRLRHLRAAIRAAAETVGEDGWIVLAISEDHPAEQTSLADLEPDHWTWARRSPEADSDFRRLLVFPAATFEAGRSVAVIAEAGRSGGIETFDGAAIYEQEVVRQIGPYVVLRATRP